MPTKKDCFSFNKGDVFEYQEYHYSQRWPSPIILIKDSIEEIIDENTFRKKRSTRSIFYSNFTAKPVEYTFEEQTFDFRDTIIPNTEQYPLGFNAENKFISEYYDTTFKRTIRKIEFQKQYLKNDTLYVLFMPPNLNSTWEIGKNIGIKRYEVSDQDPDNSWYIALTGFVTKNDTLGSLTWNKLFAQDLIAADSITSLLDGCWQSSTHPNHWLKFSKEGYKYHCTALFNETSTIDEFDYYAINHEDLSSWVLRKMNGTEFATREYSDNLFCKLDSSYYTKKSDCDVKSDTYDNSLYTINYNPKTGIITIGKNENSPTIQVSIYNTEGKCLNATKCSANPYYIDLNGITKGIYRIRITNVDKTFTKKIYIK